MSACPSVPLDLNSPYATLLDAKSPTEITRRGVDWGPWLACNNPGALITAAVWAVFPADDDGSMTLSQDVLALNVASVLVTGGTLLTAPRLTCTISTDDGQSITATVQIPVRDVFAQALAA
jgi:hypothetical protein